MRIVANVDYLSDSSVKDNRDESVIDFSELNRGPAIERFEYGIAARTLDNYDAGDRPHRDRNRSLERLM